MAANAQADIETEEQVVAELARLGVSYLSRMTKHDIPWTYSPDELLRRVVCQPSSRVRVALISLFLARPEYSRYAIKALVGLNPEESLRFRAFYTAAVILQVKYARDLEAIHRGHRHKLPDLFSNDLGLAIDSSHDRLEELGHIHARLSGVDFNWAGTYENAAYLLLKRWEVEEKWKMCL